MMIDKETKAAIVAIIILALIAIASVGLEHLLR